MRTRSTSMTMFLVALASWASTSAVGQETLTLENSRVGLSFNRGTGTLIALRGDNHFAEKRLTLNESHIRRDSPLAGSCQNGASPANSTG
jgi:hypothetical protein